MNKIDVILKKDVKLLGKKGEVVKVKVGYSNYLISNGIASVFNSSSSASLKNEKRDEDRKEKRILEEALSKSNKIKGKRLVIQMKSNDGKLFGSVSHKDLATAIEEQLEMSIDKKKIVSKEIKSLGTHSIDVKLHPKVSVSLDVEVKDI